MNVQVELERMGTERPSPDFVDAERVLRRARRIMMAATAAVVSAVGATMIAIIQFTN